MVYTTSEEVRVAAGIVENENITDAEVSQSIDDATNEINGKLATIYVLPLSFIPDVISEIARKMAAAKILETEYAGIDPVYEKSGQTLMRNARSLLNNVVGRSFILLGSDNQTELPRIAINRPSGWPNNSTASQDPQNSGGDVSFRAGMVF